MKKFLLSIAALAFAGSAFAEEVVLAETDFSKVAEYSFWKSDATNAEVKDGALVITNAEAAENFWDIQYIVADNFSLTGGVDYTINVKIKDFSGPLHYNLGTWGDNVAGDVEVKESSDWQNVVINATAKADAEGNAHLLLQSGEFVGAYSIESVVISYNKAEGGETPDEPTTEKVIASYFDGTGAAFGGWGGSFEQVEEDGKPCLKYTNEESKDFWAAQMAIDLEYEIGQTYYFSFDIKGDEGEAITSGYQYAGLNNAGEQVYWGCGDVTSFKVPSEWTNIIISGTTKAAEEGQAPGRWVANLGQYVGTFYMTNVKVYIEETSSVEAIAPAVENNRTVVYNLMGVKVLDTDDASQLNTLKKGIYIVNGKKVAL